MANRRVDCLDSSPKTATGNARPDVGSLLRFSPRYLFVLAPIGPLILLGPLVLVTSDFLLPLISFDLPIITLFPLDLIAFIFALISPEYSQRRSVN